MKSQIYEQALTKQGVGFAYHESIGLADIDTAKGLRNQARLTIPLEDELVEQYAAAYKDKFEFPPLVLHRPGKGRYVPIDGNNRLAACAKVGKKWHDAYIVDVADPQVIDRLTWTFNNLVNGKRLSRDECIEHAVSFVLKYGYTAKQAAAEWSVPVWVVNRNAKTSRIRDKLRARDVKLTATLTDDVLERLSPLEEIGEDILAMAAGVVAVSGVGQDECQALVKEVKAARTHEAKADVVTRFANSDIVKQRKAETKGGKVQAPRPLPRTQLARHLLLIQRLFEDYPAKEALRPSKVEFKETREVAADVVNYLTTLFGLGALVNHKEAVG